MLWDMGSLFEKAPYSLALLGVIAFRAENGNNGWPTGENDTDLPPDFKLIHAAVCAELVRRTVSKPRSTQPCFAQVDEYSGPFQYDTGCACQVYISEEELDLRLVLFLDRQVLHYGRACPSRLRHKWFGLIMHDGDFHHMLTP
jgi:hypothetical protein